MPTYPEGKTLTVDVLLKQPLLISRNLTNLTAQKFIADRIFTRGSNEQVAGGSARFQKSESIYLDTTRDVREVGERGAFPRAGWTEDVLTAAVATYGLEVPITGLARRRHSMDQMARAQRKLSNNIVKFVDGKMITLLETDADVQTFAAAAVWSTGDIIADIANSIGLLATSDEGYENEPLTGIFHWDQWEDMVNNTALRSALPREGRNNLTAQSAAPILGLANLIISPRVTTGTGFILAPKLIGTIADELPVPGEGYSTFQPQGDHPSISVKLYPDAANPDDTILRGARWPAMWLAEPKAAVKITAL